MIFARKKRRIERLLVVEDEPLVAFDTEHFLTDAAFEIVATVDRVADACALIDGGAAIDLILVDVRLADGSGVDVARAAQAKGVPVLFVTGSLPPEAVDMAHGYLGQPYAQRDLLAASRAIDGQLDGKTPKRLAPGMELFERA